MGDAGKVMILPRGEYDIDANYEILDLVTYQGLAYLARKNSKGKLPTEPTGEYWQVFGSAESGTTIVSTLTAGQTELVITNDAITNDSLISVSTDVFGVGPTYADQNGSTLTLTFDARQTDMRVKVVIS